MDKRVSTLANCGQTLPSLLSELSLSPCRGHSVCGSHGIGSLNIICMQVISRDRRSPVILMQMPLVLYIRDTINVKPRNNPDVIMLNCVSKGGRRTGAGDTPSLPGLEGDAGMTFLCGA